MFIDLKGSFYQNNGNFYVFSSPILEVGISNALSEVKYNYAKFLERGGLYAW
jgi:radical S-adenosyl methionine domain-containing protein 2